VAALAALEHPSVGVARARYGVGLERAARPPWQR
jgi:hypothetical protein